MSSRRLDRVRDGIEAASAHDGFALDPGQRDVLARLLQVAAGLLGPGSRHRTAPRPDRRGLYVWGPPGRGKSWLAGSFFTALSAELADGATQRVHVYDLFRELHAAIHARRPSSG
ncbi:AFG1/ZapE family ATPase [Cellulosimicrobium sp. Marseille-Q4280]|uniref:AFG1/ZapE family ATPase n=1 Tax=Cellulosimicrobium sp. Marseille-Q4280 TaxID=2937992 RepID=UPI0020411B0A|nr:AFG1/ZapE family ATPase [Cellulosimicrobium sp. Marseille-Q4280]